MRKKDKLKVIMEANNRVENSYLKSKGLIKENDSEQNIDSLLQNPEVQNLIKSLASNPEKIKKAAKELINIGISRDELLDTARALKNGQSVDSMVKNMTESVLKKYVVNEVEDKPLPTYKGDIEANDEKIEKKEVDKDFFDVVDIASGAKMGGILGALAGSLLDLGLFAGGSDNLKLYIPSLVMVVAAAIAGGKVGHVVKKEADWLKGYTDRVKKREAGEDI